ncbi:hypothetical protein BH10ACT7_BH10ACT7_30310 [soil metagenome]
MPDNGRVGTKKVTDAELARRVSILTAEHAGLQAQRGSTQAEILVRQGLYLTVASAVLVSLGLVAQAIGFSRDFFIVATCALAVLLILGIVTLTRQANADAEDIMYVLALNRIRGAYAAIEPEVAAEFILSTHDDPEGAFVTYYPFASRRNTVFASASMFLTIVNGGIAGLLAGTISALAGGGLIVSVIVGVVIAAIAIVLVLLAILLGFRRTQREHVPRYPSLLT